MITTTCFRGAIRYISRYLDENVPEAMNVVTY